MASPSHQSGRNDIETLLVATQMYYVFFLVSASSVTLETLEFHFTALEWNFPVCKIDK